MYDINHSTKKKKITPDLLIRVFIREKEKNKDPPKVNFPLSIGEKKYV